MHRAVHQTLDQLLFIDPFARRNIGPGLRCPREPSPQVERSWYASYLRALLAVRSRVAEDALAACVGNGVRQYVVLGAGLDTFGLRNTNAALRVFEVDHPQTQGSKRPLVGQEGLAVPSTLTFVPVNFEHQQLEAELLAAGLDPAQPTFFSWLGVTPYLERPAITYPGDHRRSPETGGGLRLHQATSLRRLTRLAVARAQSVAGWGAARAPPDPVTVQADLARLDC
jgi:methyltransferase (TIGR00027 family)